jgi:DNA-binding winged helix-turn-helix (wHTH) protein/tetratricopeptide (TPR) repeat protein
MAADPDLRRGFEFGPFQIIPERGIVRRDGEDVHLEPKQMDALVTLARHHPNVVSKDHLVEEVWGGRATADESIVQCIKGIRQALDKDDPRNPKYVETIHGRGYRLMVPPRFPEAAAAEAERMQVPRTWWIAGAAAVLLLVFIFIQGDETVDTSPAVESVVVTRFVNMSGEQNQFLVDGFGEQLISTLYQIPDLRVLKGNLPAEDEAPRDIASRYDVDTVVSGSVQQLNGQFTIRTSVYAEDPANRCGQSFRGTTQDMFNLHEQVATAVRDCLVGATGETVSPASKPAGSVSYLRYLRGMSFLARRDLNSLNQAAELFLGSIEIDPACGSAYLALANTYVLLADYGTENEMFDLAIATVQEGITRDASIREPAQTYMGYVQTKRGDWAAATQSFETATGSSIEYPPAQHYYSRLMAATGRIDESLTAAQVAWEMDREDGVLNSRLGIAHFWKNDMEQARQFYDIANAMDFNAPIHLLSYALFLIRDDRLDEARDVAQRAMVRYQLDASWVDPVFDALGRLPDSAPLVSVLEEYTARGVIPQNALATFWVLGAQADRAMEMAWELVDDPNYFEIELLYLDEFRILRQHEDFPRLLDELGLTDYWQAAGCEWDNDAGICRSS